MLNTEVENIQTSSSLPSLKLRNTQKVQVFVCFSILKKSHIEILPRPFLFQTLKILVEVEKARSHGLIRDFLDINTLV